MFDSLLRILALIKKELLAILKDPRTRVVLVLPTIIQCLVFGYAASYDLNHIPYAVLDQDKSDASHNLLARLDGSGVFERVADLSRAAGAKDMIDDRRALLVVQIAQDFQRRLGTGQSADVQIIADGRNSNTASTALGYVNTVVDAFNADWRQAHALPDPPVRVTTRTWFNPNLQTRWSMIPSLIGTLTMIQVLILTGMSVAREREQGTFDQLLVTPFRPAEIMVGKTLPAMLVGMIQATLIVLVGQLWFRIPFAGSVITLYAGIIPFLLAAAGLGLAVSSIATTMQQAMLYSFVILLPFIVLSGFTTPIANMPQAVQYFSCANPLRYAIDISQRVYLEGVGLGELLYDIWPLAVIAAITLSTASWMFRRQLV